MIRTLIHTDKDKIEKLLIDTNNFNADEIKIALELIDVYLNFKDQKDYEFFVDEEEGIIRGYICIGPRPLTKATYDLYWIAVNPHCQSKGIGSGLIKFAEGFIYSKTGNLILIETSGKPAYEKERRFYEKNKYSKLVEIKDFYDVNDSLVIYAKYLTGEAAL